MVPSLISIKLNRDTGSRSVQCRRYPVQKITEMSQHYSCEIIYFLYEQKIPKNDGTGIKFSKILIKYEPSIIPNSSFGSPLR